MPGLRASGTELALQIGLGELGVEQGQFRRGMAQQVHERGEADTRPHHLGSECVTEHVGNEGPGNAERGSHLGQCGAEFA